MSTAKPSGYGTMQIGEQERPYQVGTNQGDVFQRLRRVSMKEYDALFSLQALQAQSYTSGDLRDFVYSALVAGYENDGLPVDFTHMNVGNWIDAAGPDEAAEVVKPLMEMVGQMKARIEQHLDRAKNATALTLPVAKGPKKPTMKKA